MVPQWTAVEGRRIERPFEFRDFAQALRFINAIGAIAEEEGHHPDMLVHGWNKVRVTLWTHAIEGLSINDFILASKIDRIKVV
jgi:4a-hydroxytetrahydrobiopterin dehydratase